MVGKRILLVDDEPDILELMRTLLEEHLGMPAHVDTAPTGEAGLALLRARRYDMVIADQRLPGLQGSELLATCRSEQPQAVRVLMTAFAPAAVRDLPGFAGEAVVFKPLRMDDTLSRVRGALDRHAPALAGEPSRAPT